MEKLIRKEVPKVAVLLHGDVVSSFLSYLGAKSDDNEFGKIGRVIDNCPTMFYTVPFPHGNNIKSEIKIKRYAEIKELLEEGLDK